MVVDLEAAAAPSGPNDDFCDLVEQPGLALDVHTQMRWSESTRYRRPSLSELVAAENCSARGLSVGIRRPARNTVGPYLSCRLAMSFRSDYGQTR
jgi:hypothetical protein